MPPAANVQLRMQDAGWSADVERWESDEDSDQSEEERDRDVDAAEGLQLSEMAVVRLWLCIRIHWIHCVSGPCKNTQNTYLTSRVCWLATRPHEVAEQPEGVSVGLRG